MESRTDLTDRPVVWPTLTSRRVVTTLGWLVGSLVWSVVLYRYLFHAWPGSNHRFGDLYQRLNESLWILHGRDPYFVGAHISDNVPPSVSLLHLPLAELGRPWAGYVSVWLSCAAIPVICAAALSAVRPVPRSTALLVMTLVAPPAVGVMLYPGASALGAGQDQLWFMALVVVDLLVLSSRRSGYLVGAVAGLSLWPGIFAAAVLARSGVRGLVRVAIGGVVTLVAGLMFSPSASWRYWTYLVPSGQVSVRGVNSSASWPVSGFKGTWNMSINAMLTRWPLGGPFASKAAWAVCFVLLVVLGLAIAWGLWRLGLVVTSLAVLSIAVVSSSPFAWDHHWVWVVLLLPFAALECWRNHRVLSIVLWLSVLPFVRQLSRSVIAHAPKHHGQLIFSSPVDALVMNRYVLAGLAVMVAAAITVLMARRRTIGNEPA